MGHELLVFARHDLVDATLGSHDQALLLEGSWPSDTESNLRGSLDDAIDARFEWVDEEACRLAAVANELSLQSGGEEDLFHAITPAWLGVLGLRYYLVKLIRVVVYFTQVNPPRNSDNLQLVAVREHDEDYAECLEEICRLAGATFRVKWISRRQSPARSFPPNSRWRRWAARVSRLFEPGVGAAGPKRIVLCGNPRLLDPVCGELLRRDCRVWWLYDRFAVKSWLRWRTSGVGQLICESSEGRDNRFIDGAPEFLDCRGVNLAACVRRWIARRRKSHGPRETRIVEQIDTHFRRIGPHALILDEDVTGLARAAVAIGRRQGATSFVVQHGAPCCRFGFAPPAADRILAWGHSSQKQLIGWGVLREQVICVGSPQHDPLFHGSESRLCLKSPNSEGWLGHSEAVPQIGPFLGYRFALPQPPQPGLEAKPSPLQALRGRKRSTDGQGPRILLLGTTTPRDERPDAVGLQLTSRSYAETLRTAFAVVAGLPNSELVVKLHPRAPDDPIMHSLLAGFPTLKVELARTGPPQRWYHKVDCVLSCFSTAGVEAAAAGMPVIQLLPAGSVNLLPHDEWGLLGSARTESELRRLLLDVLDGDRRLPDGPDPRVFANLERPAVSQIAEAVLDRRPDKTAPDPVISRGTAGLYPIHPTATARFQTKPGSSTDHAVSSEVTGPSRKKKDN